MIISVVSKRLCIEAFGSILKKYISSYLGRTGRRDFVFSSYDCYPSGGGETGNLVRMRNKVMGNSAPSLTTLGVCEDHFASVEPLINCILILLSVGVKGSR